MNFNKIFLSVKKIKFIIAKHLIVGGSGVIINYSIFNVLYGIFQLNIFYSTLITHIFLVLIIFPLQKYFTFASSGNFFLEFIKFVVNDIFYFSLDLFFSWFFISFIGLSPLLGKALDLILITPLSFLIQYHIVFKKSSVGWLTKK